MRKESQIPVLVDPANPRVRHRANEILEQAAITEPEILGAEKRVVNSGEVQFRPPKADGSEPTSEWITVGIVYPHQL